MRLQKKYINLFNLGKSLPPLEHVQGGPVKRQKNQS